MTSRQQGSWFDDAAGPLVRPFVVARGRTTEARDDLDVITLVVTIASMSQLRRAEPEYTEILKLCELPQSVAEVSANLGLPLLVGKILIGDLIDDGLLDYRSPMPVGKPGHDDIDLMRMVLDGIRKL